MGCCLSTLDENKSKPNPNSNSNPIEKNHQFPCVSKSPPRPEEETVKEVLSETPKPKPKLKLKLKPESEPESETKPEIEVIKTEDEPINPKLLVSPKKPISDQKLNKIDPTTPEEISEVSEMQSVSETISTTTLEDQQQWAIKDSANSGELHQRRYRSQGQNRNLHHNKPNFNANGNVNHRRSPVRKRVDPSPPRRKYPGSGPGRENSTRRSRSPATRNVGRSPSGRRVGSSPGRVRMVGGPENGRMVDEEKGKGNGIESEMDGPKESLENPLVSLECFIFL